MDAIGNTQPVILPRAVAVPVVQVAPDAVPAAAIPSDGVPSLGFDAQAADQKRTQVVQQRAQDIANTHILGDQKFTMYTDPNGQLITRFRSRDGKVTYIPEPSLFKLGGNSSSAAPAVVKITA